MLVKMKLKIILYKSLKALGADVFYYIPNRVKDGYGLNVNAIENAGRYVLKNLFIIATPYLIS